MRNFNYLMMLTALVGFAAFTACERNANPETSQSSAVKFTGGVNDMSKTRAADQTWAAGDQIGVFMVRGANPVVVDAATNRQYTTTDGNGTFTPVITTEPASNSTIYYPMDTPAVPVGFIAYYPYNQSAILDETLTITLVDQQTAQPTFDLLYAKSTETYSRLNPSAVNFTFDHKMAKIVFNIVDPTTVTEPATGIAPADLADMTVTLKNEMFPAASFNLATGLFVSPTANRGDIITRKLQTPTTNYYATYDAIIVPFDYSDPEQTIEVQFTIPTTVTTPGVSGTYTLTLEQPNFVSGNVYTYNVTVTRTGIVVENSTINPWTGGGGISINAE